MYRWSYEPSPDPVDAADLGLDQVFPTQADAEAWLAASYEELADAGVSSVTLLEGDRVVYGPMSLEA